MLPCRAPVRRAPVSRAALPALAIALALSAGCGPAEELVDAAATRAPAPATSAPPGTTVPLEPMTPADELQAAMLTPEEVGTGFVAATFRPSGPQESFICGRPGIAARFQTVQAGSAASRGEDQLLVEAVHVFAGVADAERGFSAVVDGFACGSGSTVDGTPATIGPARDVTALAGGDQARAWTIDAQGTTVEVISVQAREAVVVFSYVATPGVEPITAPEPMALARTGIAKQLAA